MSLASQRPSYTRSQLSQWLELVNQTKAPESLEELEAHIAQDPLGTLKTIQLWQLAAVPFGNLGLHYSIYHTVSLDTEALFAKLIQRKLGGYCLENNAFFATVLRSLGYDLFTAGARVSNSKDHGNKNPEGYGGLGHMLVIVTVHGQRYVVDVGFGGTSGLIQPTPLVDGEMLANVPPAETRLVRKPTAQSMDQSQKLWVLEFRSDPESPWFPQYCFSEMEFFPEDFDIMNFYTSKSRTSWFTRNLVLTKLLLNDNHDEAIGSLTLWGNELKQKLNGNSTTVKFETEDDRIKALEKCFNVKLRPEEVRGIQGLPSEIR